MPDRIRTLGILLLAVCASVSADTNHLASQGEPRVTLNPPQHLPNDVKWFRDSAERKVAYAQAYALAWTTVLRELDTDIPRAWSVVLDADETVIDNSTYQMRLAQTRQPYTAATWNAWVHEQAQQSRARTPRQDFVFPAARIFITRVRAIGGKVIIVTNRSSAQCPDTAQVLKGGGGNPVVVDALICASDPKAGKEARFRQIEEGTAGFGLGKLKTLLYIGDNVMDCAGQTQKNYDEGRFGRSCIILPNPMYGSWTENADK
jgi:5'-nucleotidase (lipoprotein e(P4) family)